MPCAIMHRHCRLTTWEILVTCIYLTVEGFPETGRSESNDGDDGDDISSSTGVATIVLAIILCLVIVAGVVGVAIFVIQKK